MSGNEVAMRNMRDRIHTAMVLVAGIELPDYNDSPKLWTALEDIFDELADAVGEDGDIGPYVEEAKAIGRHFVVPRRQGNAAAMRAALEIAHDYFDGTGDTPRTDAAIAVEAALTAPPRNSDRYPTAELAIDAAIQEGIVDCDFGASEMAKWLLAPTGTKIAKRKRKSIRR